MKTLTQAKRDQARKRAQRSISDRNGPVPERNQYNNYVASKYPAWFMWLIAIMLAVVAVAAGVISGVRLYVAGYDYALATIDVVWVSVVIGVCTFLAAEVLVILAMVAGQVYLTGKQKMISAIPVTVGMVVAFVGNWTVTSPSTTWGWVETGFPPIAVLSVAFFFEITLVPELERRQADELEFQRARAVWQQIAGDVELHANWLGVYATALRDELLRLNKMSIDDLPPDEWRALIEAEMGAERWWDVDKFSVNAKNSRGKSVNDGRSQIQIATDYLRENPGEFEGLVAQIIPQSKVAYMAGVSQSTMSRALSGMSKNGNGETKNETSE